MDDAQERKRRRNRQLAELRMPEFTRLLDDLRDKHGVRYRILRLEFPEDEVDGRAPVDPADGQ